MPHTPNLNWEHVDSIVDRRINAESYHVWPFTNPIPIDVRFLIMDRHHEVPMHQPDHLEIVVFESGEMGYEVNDRACTLHKNDVIVVGDRIHHRCTPLGAAQREARSVVLSFLPELVHSGTPAGDDLRYLLPFTLQEPSLQNVIPAKAGVSREILEFIERIKAELPGSTERSRLAIRTYLKMILLAVVNHYAAMGDAQAALARRQGEARRLEPVLDHIRDRYYEPIRVNDAARLCAMSACCFMHLFKEMTGHSFVAYLNRFRVTKAQDLLVTTDKTISEISQETGYCNQSYFGVMFRRITGMTPYEYRQQHEE
ncbi:MAG: AraC family transcriptional regulator [Bryobacteraceae bacterium]